MSLTEKLLLWTYDSSKLSKRRHNNKLEAHLGEYRRQGMKPFIMHLSAAMVTNKSAFVCCVGAAPHWVDTRWHLFRNPRSHTWKGLALLLWNREINKCPCDCFRILKHRHPPDVSVCVHVTVRHCEHNMLYVISTQPPVYMKGVNKHRMNFNKAHPRSAHTSSSCS